MITLLLAGLAPAIVSPQGAELERLRFNVPAGTQLRREMLVRHELQLDGVVHTLGSETPVRQDMPGWMSTVLKVTVEDTLGEVDAGRPSKLRRRWIEQGGEGMLRLAAVPGRPKFEDRAVLSGPMRDRRVDFTWIEAENDWARLWVRDDAEEYWLAEMRGDMDALGLLPAEPVAPGSTWELSMEDVRDLLAPGGNHLITPRTTNIFGRTIEVGIGGDYAEVLGSEIAGRAAATFEGVREVDGRRMAVLTLSIEGLRTISDRTDLWRLSAPPEERNEVAHLVSALVEYGLDARGEALWNLEAGHLHSLELSGDELYLLSVTKHGGPVTQPYDTIQQSNFRGKVELKYRIGPPPPPPAEGAREH